MCWLLTWAGNKFQGNSHLPNKFYEHFSTPLEYVLSLIRWSLLCVRLLTWWDWSLIFIGHIFLPCFDTVGWVIWSVKPVPDMTYNVFGGTLNLALSLGDNYMCWMSMYYRAHLDSLLEYCKTGIEEGATLVYGGKRVERPGYYKLLLLW